MSLLIDAALAARHPRKPKKPMPVPVPTVPGNNGGNAEPGGPVDGFVAARRPSKGSGKTHKDVMDVVELSSAARRKKHPNKA